MYWHQEDDEYEIILMENKHNLNFGYAIFDGKCFDYIKLIIYTRLINSLEYVLNEKN